MQERRVALEMGNSSFASTCAATKWNHKQSDDVLRRCCASPSSVNAKIAREISSTKPLRTSRRHHGSKIAVRSPGTMKHKLLSLVKQT